MSKIEYKVGEVIGECIYLEDITLPNRTGRKRRYAKFRCRCSNEFISQIDSVKRKATKSCGCVNIASAKETGKKRKTHGMSKTKVYQCWRRMKARCYDISDKNYSNYGERGIVVCDRWRNSFENFYLDIGQYRTDGMELDRIDVNGNYTLENCKWANEQEQAWNQRFYKNSKTNCAGVTTTSRNKNKYEVRISKNNKEHYIGTFNTLEEAIEARKAAEIQFYGNELECKRGIRDTIDI